MTWPIAGVTQKYLIVTCVARRLCCSALHWHCSLHCTACLCECSCCKDWKGCAWWWWSHALNSPHSFRSCNYEARQAGVTKLMGIAEARRLCPGLVLVRCCRRGGQGGGASYMACRRRVMLRSGTYL